MARSTAPSPAPEPVVELPPPPPKEVEKGKLEPPLLEEFARVAELVSKACRKEEFKTALFLLEDALSRHDVEEWKTLVQQKKEDVREEAKKRLGLLKEKVIAARNQGADDKVKEIVDRIRAWGFDELAADFQEALKAASSPVPTTPSEPKKAEEPVKVEAAAAPSPAPEAKPDLAESSTYRGLWREALQRAGRSRSYASVLEELNSASSGIKDGEVQAEVRRDIQLVQATISIDKGILFGLAKGQTIPLEFWDVAGKRKTLQGTVQRVAGRTVELKNGFESVSIEVGEILAGSLVDLVRARREPALFKTDVPALVLFCLLDGEPSVARKLADEFDVRFPEKYWELADAISKADSPSKAKEDEARKLFHSVNRGSKSAARQHYEKLLNEFDQTLFVRRNRDSIADHLESLDAGAAASKPKSARVHPKVDQQQTDNAIDRGCKWLLSQKTEDVSFVFKRAGAPDNSRTSLVVLTLAHAGYTQKNAQMAAWVDVMLKEDVTSTYVVSLQAMALQKIDPQKYQWRIAQCAQFLADNQCNNGQWNYGETTDLGHIKESVEKQNVPTTSARKEGGTSADRTGGGGRTRPLARVQIRKNRKGATYGDNSNSQYAALGLRACMDAGIIFEKEVLALARSWWKKSQCKDGGWGYEGPGDRGWGSMTVGGIGALCIYDYFLREDYTRDLDVLRGLKWIEINYDVTCNPKFYERDKSRPDLWHAYYLYGLERAGILSGTDKIGTHDWYADGANYLLKTQKPTGEWVMDSYWQTWGGAITHTSFAILFLRRATLPLIVTEDSRAR